MVNALIPAASSRSTPTLTRQRLCVLGATGSIGQNTLAVAALNPAQFAVVAVAANRDVDAMVKICQTHQPRYAVMADKNAAQQLQTRLTALGLGNIQVSGGDEQVTALATLTDVDVVMAAIVGGAGLLSTMAAIRAGKRVLLANKEALVMSGQLFMSAVANSNAELLPVDSEHNAIFQCLPTALQQPLGQSPLADHGIAKILLTGSGGPFREVPLAELPGQTIAAACQHPNWSMGQKISVDSATMLNKGLEYIEARWLFNCTASELEVVVHPQSVIHSMVQYIDGSVIAQLGQPDMRTPIASCLSYPERVASGVGPLDFASLGNLTFESPDTARYPCLQLAMDACWQGQWATTTLNAANEIAVAAFLAGQLRFTDIAVVCEQALTHASQSELNSIDEVLATDAEARSVATECVRKRQLC